MNDPEESLPDEMLSDMLAPLRDVSVPEDVRAANRAAIARALARHTRAPWWRRTVAVPLPLAIAATVAIIAASIALVVPASVPQMVDSDPVSPIENQLVTSGAMPSLTPRDPERPTWSVSRSYIQSIESLATTQVPINSDL